MNRTADTNVLRAVLALMATLALTACGGGGGPQPGADDVAVTLRDYAVEVADSTLPAGSTKLAIQNVGAGVHELEVFAVPAGVDAAALPVANSVADTDSAGLTVVDEIENVAPGTRPSLTVSLQPGTYVFMCNLPTHYQLGMHAVVTVE
jgi:uncharacterized cupredoxin-like copper-binding protein